MKKILLAVTVILSVFSLTAPVPAFAETNANWLGGTDTWDTNGNWLGGAKPTENGMATFDYAFGGETTVDLTPSGLDPVAISVIRFENTPEVLVPYLIGTSAAQTITLKDLYPNVPFVGRGVIITSANVNTTQTIQASINLLADADFTNDGVDENSVLNITGNVTGGAASTLTLNGAIAGTSAVSGDIADGAGALALIKDGAGTWTLSGDNTYTGTTRIMAGTLVLEGGSAIKDTGAVTLDDAVGATLRLGAGETIGSLAGGGADGGDVDLQAFTLTSGGDDTSTEYGGIISGTGGLTKTGAGTLTLSGANIYTGDTTISAGELDLNADSAESIAGNLIIDGGTLKWLASDQVADAATLDMTSGAVDLNGMTETITAFTNSGGVFTTGAGHLIGADGPKTITWAGGTNTINNGGVVEDIHILLSGGTNTVEGGDTGGVLQLNGAGEGLELTGATLTLNSDADVAGKLLLQGDVIGNASAATSYINSGGSAANPGNIDLDGGTRAFNIASGTTAGGIDMEIGAQIINGGLQKTGDGVLNLTAANTYAGGTTIDAGTLKVANADAVGTGDLTNNATLNVGTTSLSVPGVYTQAAGSTLALTANSSSSYGNIASVCDAFVDTGSTVAVTVSGYIPNKATIKVIDGAGGANVQVPETITSSNSKYTFTGSILSGDLILTANRSATNGFAGSATNSNSFAVGGVLDNITNPSGDMLTVLDTLDSLGSTAVGQSLQTFTPVVDNGVNNASNSSLAQFIGTIGERLGGLFARARDEQTGVSTGSKGTSGFEAWGRGFGEYARQDPRGTSNGYRATIWGTALGGDLPAFNDRMRFGASGGYAASRVNSKDNSGRTGINSYQTTFYGGYMDANKPYYVNGAFSFAYNTYKGKRDIAVGATARRANASYRGQQYSVLVDGGYTFNTKNVNITPVASLQYLRLHLQSYTETGAGALNLSVASQDYDMLQSGLGMKLDHSFETKSATIVPEVHVRWLYEFLGEKQATTSTFSGGGGSFATQGFDPAQHSLNVGGKIALLTKGNWSFDANYDFEYKQDFTSHTGWADIRYKF